LLADPADDTADESQHGSHARYFNPHMARMPRQGVAFRACLRHGGGEHLVFGGDEVPLRSEILISINGFF